MTLDEINRVGELVTEHLDDDANVIWGARILPEFEGKVQVITIITGVKSPYILGPVQTREQPVIREVSKVLGIDIIR